MNVKINTKNIILDAGNLFSSDSQPRICCVVFKLKPTLIIINFGYWAMPAWMLLAL